MPSVIELALNPLGAHMDPGCRRPVGRHEIGSQNHGIHPQHKPYMYGMATNASFFRIACKGTGASKAFVGNRGGRCPGVGGGGECGFQDTCAASKEVLRAELGSIVMLCAIAASATWLLPTCRNNKLGVPIGLYDARAIPAALQK